jgi:helicase
MEEADRAVSRLDLPSNVTTFLQQSWGINHLHPPQFEAMPSVLGGTNTLLAIPTASGKSLVAYLGIMKRVLVDDVGSKAVYIVPLKALASEKFEDLSELCSAVGLTVGLGIGDASAEAKKIDECDVLVCTSEKLDSLMRNRSELMANVSIVVADEFHLMNDGTRGPTLEINLTRLRHLRPKAQIIALSATVGNCEDLAKWLDATLIISDWRPVALEYSTFHDLHLEPRLVQSSAMASDGEALQPPRDLEGPKSHPTWVVVNDTIDQDGQVLVFVGTRRSAQSEALKLSKRVEKRLAKEDPDRLKRLAVFADSLEGRQQTAMAERLATAIRGGVAFHHAGLTHGQRKAIEGAFKEGLLIGLTATPTLAAGVNLPARRVLVRDLKRWDDGMSRPLPVMEVRQMLGRAGRPKYDAFGEAWVLCKGTDGWAIADDVSHRYFFGPVESITSKLSSEPALRTHLLAAIAAGGFRHRGELGDFFQATFLGSSVSPTYLKEQLDRMLDWLVAERFIRRVGVDDDYVARRADKKAGEADDEDWDDEMPIWASIAQNTGGVDLQATNQVFSEPVTPSGSAFKKASLGFTQATDLAHVGGWNEPAGIDHHGMVYEATMMGEKVTQMYLDPLSASQLRTGLRRAVRRLVRQNAPVTMFSLLQLATTTPDFSSLWAKNSDMEANSLLWLKTNTVEEELLTDITLQERLLGYVKSAWMLEKWIEEETLRDIETDLDVSPGDVNHRVDLMGWLLAAARQVLLTDDVFSEDHLGEIDQLSTMIDELRQRIRHGCKPDLLNLVNIKHVGRARAREMSKLNLRSPRDVIGMSASQRSNLLALRGWGPVLLQNIFTEVQKVLDKEQKMTGRPSASKLHEDDVPLSGESPSDD